MFFELLFFTALGIVLGVIFGLIPGIHPNMIVLSLPLLMTLNLNPVLLIAFVVALGISNAMTDFLPSMLLGAPDGSELAVLPGHRMLMQGHGYYAVKLAVVGGFFSVIFVAIILPVIILSVPLLYDFIRPFIYIILILFSSFMILTEKRKVLALTCFLLAASIGLMLDSLPVNGLLILFPVLSGFFGASMLLLQLKSKVSVPKQKKGEIYVTQRTVTRSITSGTLAGIAAGFLPGVGTSELSAFASVDKNEKSFLITFGAITTSNVLLSLLSLWLIGRARSGIAVVIEQLTEITLFEVLIMVAAALIAVSLSAVIVLRLARRFISFIEKVNYSTVSGAILLLIVFMTLSFTGIYGLLILITCTSLGIVANITNIKRGLLMAVLIVPTIVFYAPI